MRRAEMSDGSLSTFGDSRVERLGCNSHRELWEVLAMQMFLAPYDLGWNGAGETASWGVRGSAPKSPNPESVEE